MLTGIVAGAASGADSVLAVEAVVRMTVRLAWRARELFAAGVAAGVQEAQGRQSVRGVLRLWARRHGASGAVTAGFYSSFACRYL